MVPCYVINDSKLYKKILWDKHMHGRNLAKNPLFNDDTTCPHSSDTQYRIIRECQHKPMRGCRQKHIALLDIRHPPLVWWRGVPGRLYQEYCG